MFVKYSGALGHITPRGHDDNKPIRNAGMFKITANLYGHGHTWNRAVEVQSVWSPRKGRLRIVDRCQRPNPPKATASTHCVVGSNVQNRFNRSIIAASLDYWTPGKAQLASDN